MKMCVLLANSATASMHNRCAQARAYTVDMGGPKVSKRASTVQQKRARWPDNVNLMLPKPT